MTVSAHNMMQSLQLSMVVSLLTRFHMRFLALPSRRQKNGVFTWLHPLKGIIKNWNLLKSRIFVSYQLWLCLIIPFFGFETFISGIIYEKNQWKPLKYKNFWLNFHFYNFGQFCHFDTRGRGVRRYKGSKNDFSYLDHAL